MNKIISCVLKFFLLFGLLWLSVPSAVADDPAAIIKNGKLYANLRYRLEVVDQKGIDKTATASTMRARLGLITGEYKNFQASVELDLIGTAGTSRFNSTINGKSQFPVVADPTTNELNALWLLWKGLPDTAIKLGRQPINLDNQRFIGTVGFRQNDQTYDAVTITNTSINNLHLFYSFTDQVNRIFGHKSPVGRFHTDIHMGRAEYKFLPSQKLIAYNYWLNLNKRFSSLSSKTYGLRLVGKVLVANELSLTYLLEGARQHDNGNNPNNYSAYYYHIAPGIKWQAFTAGIGIESLGGNGSNAFSTPLATLHAHNGWADKFLATPGSGLQDIYLRAAYRVSGISKWVDNTVVKLVYHDFNAVKGSASYGTEWNVSVSRAFDAKDIKLFPYMKQWSIGLKYADYNAQGLFTDTRKGWFTLAAKF